MNKISIAGPSITDLELEYVKDAVINGWYENCNSYIDKFEKMFANYVGRKFAISLPSCTSAIHLSLLSLNISSNDEVLIPDITWIASAAPISYIGAKPVFCDIDNKTWCISLDSIKKSVTDKTKAIILVDLYGGMPDLDEIIDFAKEKNIFVIEDSAEAVGSEYKGRKAGSFGDCSVFSFHGSKTLTTGEGGILLTDNEDIYRRALFLRDHGRDPNSSKMFWNSEIAYKYKMSNLQAALGLAQLERIHELIKKKTEIFNQYNKNLGDISYIKLNHQDIVTKNSFWMTTAVFDKNLNLKKEEIIEKLAVKGIQTRPFFYPLSSLPAYKHYSDYQYDKKNINSYEISPYGINLPSSLKIAKNDIDYVCQALRDLICSK